MYDDPFSVVLKKDWHKPYTQIPKDILLDEYLTPVDKCFLFLVLHWETQGKEARFSLAWAGDRLGESRSTIQRAIERLSIGTPEKLSVVRSAFGSTYETTVSKNGRYEGPNAILMNPLLEPFEKAFLLIIHNFNGKELKKVHVQRWAKISRSLVFRLYKDLVDWKVIMKDGDGYRVCDPNDHGCWALPQSRAMRAGRGTREREARIAGGWSSTAEDNYKRMEDKRSKDESEKEPA